MGTDFIDDLDINYPDGDVHKVPVLDDDNRKTKDAIVNTVGAEHDNATGEHTIPSVTDAQEAALNEQDGRLIWNNTDGVIKINITAAWLQIGFPSGTRMLFDQDAAPAGWTRNTDDNDRMVRIVSGARADAGSWTISGLTNAAEAAHTHSGPSHSHVLTTSGTAVNIDTNPPNSIIDDGGLMGIASLTGAEVFNRLTKTTNAQGTGNTGAGVSHNHVISSDAVWRPLHRDVIVAVKD